MEHPPLWTTYLVTDDAAATAEKITAAGGQVVMAPRDVMELGVMANGAGPDRRHVRHLAIEEMTGVKLADAAGSLTWNELMIRDYRGGDGLLRGRVRLHEHRDGMPHGRYADVADPQGARLSIIKGATPEQPG
jgi:hypothetical protein